MFLSLLGITFAIAVCCSILTAWMFDRSIHAILERIMTNEMSAAWQRYIRYAIIVVGVSGGVRVWDLEKYITPVKGQPVLVLTRDRWVLEIYRTVIGTLQSVAWLLLLFFAAVLIAFAIVKGLEGRRQTT